MAKKHKLDKKEAAVKPPFVMAAPNDDAAAFGWSLGKLRYPSKDSKPGDIWPGAGMFDFPVPYEIKQVYGHSIDFVNPAFLQLLFDSNPAIRKGVERVRAAGYTPEAIAKYRKIVLAEFESAIIPEITRRFAEIAQHVAEFYCARLAHIDTFGVEE